MVAAPLTDGSASALTSAQGGVALGVHATVACPCWPSWGHAVQACAALRRVGNCYIVGGVSSWRTLPLVAAAAVAGRRWLHDHM